MLASELPSDLCIYPRELKAGSREDMCAPMLAAATFTIAKQYQHGLTVSLAGPSVSHYATVSSKNHFLQKHPLLEEDQEKASALAWHSRRPQPGPTAETPVPTHAGYLCAMHKMNN